MNSVDIEVLRSAVAWRREGHDVVLATVVKTWGSSPRPVGAMAAVRADGRLSGSVSGGCIEDDLIERVKEFSCGAPRVITYGVTLEQTQRYGLPCGGKLQLLVEPIRDSSTLEQVLRSIEKRELAARKLDLETSKAFVVPASPDDVLTLKDNIFTTVHGPRWRMLIIGAVDASRYLAQMAQALDYQVLVCDPRAEFAAMWDIPGAKYLAGMPDDVVRGLLPDCQTVIIALTHDPRLDDLALLEALKSDAFYVGAIGSRKNNARRRERLAQHFDLTSEELARLHGPVGLSIRSRTPPEIAVAILAELTALRNGVVISTRPPAEAEAGEACSSLL